MNEAAAGALGLALGAVAAWAWLRRARLPMEAELRRLLERWAVGDLAEPVKMPAFSSVDGLGEALERARAEQWRVFNEGLREVTLERLRLETLVRQLGDGVILCNLRGQILRVNTAAARLLGLREGEQAADDARTRAAVQNLLKRRTISELVDLPGGSCYADVSVLETPNSNDVSVSIVLRDASARQRGERQVEDVFRAVAEELGGPIRALQGYLRLLAGALQPDKRQKDYLDAVTQSCEDLSALLQDAVDAARLEQGRLSFSVMPCDPEGLLRRCAATVRPLAEQKGLAVAVKLAEDRPESIDMDERLIERVLCRLAAEAAAGPRRGGTLELGLSRAGSVRAQLWVAVPAPPAPAAAGAAAAFEAAAPKAGQPASSRAAETCRKLVAAHGGELRVETGRWTLILPLRRGYDGPVKQG